MTNQHQPSDEIVRAVETLVDAVIVQHPNADQEIFLECKVCGEWDGHKPTCFLPVLLAWRNDKPIPTPVRDTVAALVSVARDYLRDTGGCDHSVNISASVASSRPWTTVRNCWHQPVYKRGSQVAQHRER